MTPPPGNGGGAGAASTDPRPNPETATAPKTSEAEKSVSHAETVVQAGQQQALEVARRLIEMGVPVFAAPPVLDEGGTWDPTGGTGGCGYWLPSSWQKTVPTARWLDPTAPGFEQKAWRPGWALAAVMGNGLDALDVDPRNGGDDSRAALVAAGRWPKVYGKAETPSGGTHELVASLGIHSRDGVRPGLDVKAGAPDGQGRGFIFIAPTRKRSKVTGEIAEYQWLTAPTMGADDTGRAFAEIVRPPRPPERPSTPRASTPRAEGDPRLTAYAETAWNGEVARLVAMAEAATPDGHGYRGESWDATTFEVACNLLELATAAWTGYSDEDAHAAVRGHAPRDAGFTDEHVQRKLESAVAKVGSKARPAPPEQVDLAAEVAGWDIPRARVPDEAADQSAEGKGERLPAEGALTDARMSADVASHLRPRFRWCPGLGWLRYDGKRWTPADDSAALEMVRRYLVNLHARQARKGLKKEDLAPFAALLGAPRMSNMTKLSKGQLLVETGELDTHPHLLNVGNGVVDLRTGELRPHDPDLLLTKVTATSYRPDATHPDWDAALTALPDVDTREWLQDKFGQGVTGHMSSDDTFVIAEGAGSNGKSAVVNAILSAAGEHAVIVPDRVLLSNAGDHPTEMMTLRGARIAIIEEAPEGRRLNVKRLKDVVGTSQIAARLIRRDNVTFDATHSLFMTTNYSLDIAETDHGTWRRLARVRFPLTYRVEGKPLEGPDDRRGDPLLRERLKVGQDGQHEAVLRWLVDGARRWYAAGQVLPPPPKQVHLDTLAWRSEADLVLSFFREHLCVDSTGYISSADLCATFRKWLQQAGHPTWTDRTITSRFGAHDVVTSAGIRSDRSQPGPGHSRPPDAFLKPSGTRFRSWVGVRFVRPDESGWDDV